MAKQRKSRCEICKFRERYTDIDKIFYTKDGRTQKEHIDEILDFIEKLSKHRYNPTTIYKCFKNHNTPAEQLRKEEIKDKIDDIKEINDKDLVDILIKNKKLNEAVFLKLYDLILEDKLDITGLSIIFQNTSRNIDTFTNTIMKINTKDAEENKANTNININLGEDLSKVELFTEEEFNRLDKIYTQNTSEINNGNNNE